MKLLLIQPGRFGDILICLPIAGYYAAMGYEVYWPVPQNYCPLFRNIDYAIPVSLPFNEFNIIRPIYQLQHNNTFDKVVDLSFGFGGRVDGWWKINRDRYNSFVTAKYQLANVPVEQRWNLHWTRNMANESALYDLITPPGNYILVHNTTYSGTLFEITDKRQTVYFQPQGEFNIFDWYKVILGAEEIYCLDSSLSNFIETIEEAAPIRKHIKPFEGFRDNPSIYRNNWS